MQSVWVSEKDTEGLFKKKNLKKIWDEIKREKGKLGKYAEPN